VSHLIESTCDPCLTEIVCISIRNIRVGEEITVFYSDNYFGEDNRECLCRHCEDLGQNGWSQDLPKKEKRSPRDYLTSLAWNRCNGCLVPASLPGNDVTRGRCPVCNRHRKLYGYPWPKTKPAGRSDTEERLYDIPDRMTRRSARRPRSQPRTNRGGVSKASTSNIERPTTGSTNWHK
jgi:hypothetical protein